jgi:parvulin-like peptidyl-prolyl isomerase
MSGQTWLRAAATTAGVLALVAGRAPAQAPAVKPAAVVNGEAISFAEVEAVLKQRPPTATQPTEAQQRQLRLDALSMLMDDLLMQQFLRKNGPKTEPAEVDRQLVALQANLKSQGRNLQEFLRDSHMTEAQLRTNTVLMLQWAAYAKARTNEADVKRYYDDNKEFFDQVTVRASHIVLRLPPTASEGERQEARQRLQALRQEIVAGKLDFAEAAKKHSQCPSAPSGGDIGYFSRKWMLDEAFAKTAFALKVGDVSDVVQSDYGLHLIKVTDRKPGQPSVYEKIKDEVREFYVEELRQSILAQERKKAQIQVNLP